MVNGQKLLNSVSKLIDAIARNDIPTSEEYKQEIEKILDFKFEDFNDVEFKDINREIARKLNRINI